MRLFKDRVWKELHGRVVNEDHIGKSGLWSSRDSEIFLTPSHLDCYAKKLKNWKIR